MRKLSPCLSSFLISIGWQGPSFAIAPRMSSLGIFCKPGMCKFSRVGFIKFLFLVMKLKNPYTRREGVVGKFLSIGTLVVSLLLPQNTPPRRVPITIYYDEEMSAKGDVACFIEEVI